MKSIQKLLFLSQPKFPTARRRGVWTRQLGKAVFYMAMFLVYFSSVALAAQEKPQPEEPKVNPLEITTPDPLLPKPPKRGSLSPEEQSRLRQSLDELNTQATALLQGGKPLEAFDIWYRELRLRRALGYLEEVQALGRVGEIAWQRTQKYDAKVITLRLQEIQKEAENKKLMNFELLQALGKAYQQVRLLEPAVGVYEKILVDERTRGDVAAQEATLKTLAELNLAWFDYPKAAAAYEELLTQAQAKGDRINQVVYLQQLLYVYDKGKEPANALKAKQRLAETYLNQKDFTKIPALKIAIGSDYEALNQPDEASQNYQEAYSLAWSSRQFAYASEALKKLGALYRSHTQPDYALQVYEVLLKSEQQLSNFYGLMDAYDQMGQIYLEQKNYTQALAVYQKGLELAKSLQYQETYFTNQIERVTKQTSQ
ncbi:MAG TPA: tetratricopeptide repeat protein [Candidatus Sericytochromatia bacterium]